MVKLKEILENDYLKSQDRGYLGGREGMAVEKGLEWGSLRGVGSALYLDLDAGFKVLTLKTH
jgi:hypothetical protein